jgi:hypothetical protein
MSGFRNRIATALLLAAPPTLSEETQFPANGSHTSLIGPSDYFVGTAVIDSMFCATEQLQGTGWSQEEGGVKREIKPSDVIWTSLGVKHLHGTTENTLMGHFVI